MWTSESRLYVRVASGQTVPRSDTLTVLENAVRPATDSAHQPVGEPAGQHSTANQMSGLQATDRTSGAPAMRTEIDSAHSAAPLPKK